MKTYVLTYIPRTAGLAPRAGDVATLEIEALHARHAAQKAAAIERRTGNRVLTVKEKP